MKNYIETDRRTFAAKAAWQVSKGKIIGEIDAVVEQALTFANGIEWIKELDETDMKFKKVSKADIHRLLVGIDRQDLSDKLKQVY